MSTRIRAIPSTLSVKASPLVPAATTSFDPAVKNVLRHRLIYNMFLTTLAFSWVQTTTIFIWTLGGLDVIGIRGALWIPIRPFTLLATIATWLSVAVPVLVLRKSCLTVQESVQTSPYKTIQAALRRPSTRQTFLTYLLSALLAAAIYVSISRINEPSDPRLSVFVKSKKHPTYLNGRLVFLVLSQICISCFASLRNIMLDRLVFRWSSQHKPLSIGDFIRVLVVTTLLASISVPLSLPLFAILRVFIRLPILRTLLKPFMAHFARGSYSFILLFHHIPLISRAWALAWTTFNIWEIAEMVFDAHVSKPVPINSAEILVSGASSSDIVFKYFAFSQITPQTIFSASTSTLWPALCRESLLILGRDYQHFLRRGAPPTVPIVPPPPAKQPISIPATPVKALRQPIFRTESRSPVSQVIDSLAGDSNAEVPDVMKNIMPAPPTATIDLSRFTPKVTIPAWLTEERLSKVVESLLPSRNLDLLVIDVLSKIVSASLAEDKYGVVQRDIPKILEAMCVFLDEVETYQQDLIPGDDEERRKAFEVLGRVADGLRDGISRIVRTFGTKLSAFKFPPRVARKLQGFVDYL